jgi:predicted nucleic-acid-binding protein
MQAVDTNVVVRYLTGDDVAQAARARGLIDGGDVWLGLTVVLETAWVLRSAYRFPQADIIAAFRTLAGQPTVHVENAGVLAQALTLCDGGLDFADALHVSVAATVGGFSTFDAALVARAGRLGVVSVTLL